MFADTRKPETQYVPPPLFKPYGDGRFMFECTVDRVNKNGGKPTIDKIIVRSDSISEAYAIIKNHADFIGDCKKIVRVRPSK